MLTTPVVPEFFTQYGTPVLVAGSVYVTAAPAVAF
jgi:hypothetical protein